MRVLHVFYGRDIAGGASYSMATLVEGLARHGHEVHALLPRTGRRVMAERLTEAGITCHEMTVPWQVYDAKGSTVSTRLKNYAKGIWSLATTAVMEIVTLTLIRRHQIDVVHIGGAVITTGSVAARVLKVPLVWHVREFVEEGLGFRYFPWINFYRALSRAHAVVCVSDELSGKMRNFTASHRVRTVANGLALPPAAIAPRVSGGAIRLMSAGGLNRSKGIFVLMEALSGLPRDLQCSLDVYGRANPDQLAEFARECERLGLQDVVTYRGHHPDMPEVYRSHDACVVASTKEAFGRVTVEAMLSGCLVVGSDSGGTRELLRDNRGLLFAPDDPFALRSALARVLQNYSSFDVVRQRAVAYAQSEFSVDRYVGKVAETYANVVQGV